jgi:hypothetical protein
MLRAVLTRPAFVHLGACAVALFAAGCGINCDRNPDEPAVDYRGGVTTSAGAYDSAPEGENSPWLTFPAGRTYRFYHDLGGPPRDIRPSLAFAERCGAGDRKVERYTPGVGNQVTIEDNTHPDYFDIRNDTCAEVCLRVYASDPILSSEPREDDAGSSEGADSGAE